MRSTNETAQKQSRPNLWAWFRAVFIGNRHNGSTDKLRRIIRTALQRRMNRVEYVDQACKGQTRLREDVTELLRRIDQIVEEALRLSSEEYVGFIDVKCRDQPLVREGVLILLDLLEKKVHQASVSSQTSRYVLGEVLGHGGMGTVYRAEQLEPLQRQVALKLIDPQIIDEERFNTEVMALSRLGAHPHPNIVTFFEAGRREGTPFIAMELLPKDSSLHHRLTKEGPLAPEQAIRMMLALASAIQWAHQLGIFHRDLKPHNILLQNDGRAKLTDFGLARCIDESIRPTLSGQGLGGTPGFMAPEQMFGQLDDSKAYAVDVYGLGAVLYACLTAGPPIQRAVRTSLANWSFRRILGRLPS